MIGPVEIAGLALAVVPIVTSVAEYRCGSLRPALQQKAKDNKVAEYYQLLLNELAFLGVYLRRLIGDLPTLSEDQRTRLLNLEDSLWKTEETANALKSRLGDAYEAFLDHVKGILILLDNIISDQSLGLDRADLLAQEDTRQLYAKLKQLRSDAGKNRESVASRFRFTKNERKLRKSLKEITEKNKILERLLNGAPIPELPNQAESHGTFTRPSRQVSELAKAVYDAFVRLWSCGCSVPHEARLCMKMPLEDGDCNLPARLDMYVSICETNSDEKWQDSSVHIDAGVRPRLEGTRPHAHAHFVGTNEQPRLPGQRRSSTTEKFMKPIDTMCGLMNTVYQSGAVLEVMLHNDSLWHIKPTRPREKVQGSTSLQDLLSRAKKLSEKDRRSLAVLLANALLYLKDSRWLDDHWTKKDICFITSTGEDFDIGRPYLESNFKESLASAAANEPDLLQLHQCPPILGLGVMLLELGLSAPIEKLRLEDDTVNGTVNPNTDLITAGRVLSESEGDLHDGYRAAVQACLDCHFVPDGSFDFADEEFRGLVYQHIVEPLETELYHGWKIKASDLWSETVSS